MMSLKPPDDSLDWKLVGQRFTMHLDTLFDLVFGLTATVLATLGIYLTYKHRKCMSTLPGASG